MKTQPDILDEIGGKTGYRVPDHYFDDVRSKILADLPEYKIEKAPRLTAWQRVKPYLYMAAMFAGIWCMMKMMHIISSSDLSLDNPPETVAVAMADSDPYDWSYNSSDPVDAFMLEDQVADSYSSFEEFTRDFNSAATM